MTRYILLLMCAMVLPFQTLSAATKFSEKAVRKVVQHQMQTYPKSTLKDLYKNFFQDEFGPGHIIKDTTSAGNYLRSELASYQEITGPVAEPTGWKGNYVRVNLSVLKSGKVPYDVFFSAFVRSVNGIHPITVPQWRDEWMKIVKEIRERYSALPDFEKDEAEIEARFARGEFQGDHSEVYEQTYSPHYRILSRAIYQKEIEPLLKK